MGNRNYRTTIDARGRYGTAFFCFLTLDGIRSSLKESRSKPMPERQDFCQTGTGKQPLEPINGGPKLENYQRIYMWELRVSPCPRRISEGSRSTWWLPEEPPVETCGVRR